MTPCARGCCWVPMPGICAQQRSCACHWEERRPTTERGTGHTHRDPTANEAIRRAMKGQK